MRSIKCILGYHKVTKWRNSLLSYFEECGECERCSKRIYRPRTKVFENLTIHNGSVVLDLDNPEVAERVCKKITKHYNKE